MKTNLNNKDKLVNTVFSTVYKKYDLKNIFLGHHFADLKEEKKSDVFKKFNLDKKKKFVSIMPGSRKSEIKNIIIQYCDNDYDENKEFASGE